MKGIQWFFSVLATGLILTGCEEKKETEEKPKEVTQEEIEKDLWEEVGDIYLSEKTSETDLGEEEVLHVFLEGLQNNQPEEAYTRITSSFFHEWGGLEDGQLLWKGRVVEDYEIIPTDEEGRYLVRFRDKQNPYRFEARLVTEEGTFKVDTWKEVSRDEFVARTVEPVDVKGLYLSGHSVELESRFQQVLELLDETELNALVIDVKEDDGFLTYDSDVELVNEYGSDERTFIRDIKSKMNELKERNIYTIARIVTFKDPYIALKNPDWAMKRASDGGVWKDKSGVAWVDPYKEDYWRYPIEIAKEAAKLGFDEIQFDYVRFPALSETQRNAIRFDNPNEVKRDDAIKNFLMEAKEELAPYGVLLSADVFGLVTSVEDDMGIGQTWEKISNVVDVISPMTYPSHYGVGSYGIQYPDSQPYNVIQQAMKDALEKQAGMENNGYETAVIRPWYQDFTATWVPGSIHYGPQQIKAQIQAAKEQGVTQYLMWDAANTYTEGAWR
ncbi:putative glycoside hydrolase (plasmid) [Pontibacillus sp. ALD_SL1]|uniref:putative glycoside hydrolase n=1 Tax=Pontibacillus sp. ALD_SL1 TaxID=2777185 RepID=UPI001A96102C|nr:putative glycoside hydrolase [Pontibacillus sp. ALD_SL1]QST02749.1 putative glycoside hydrolase [Pontibacillus sp. ALD_SL1]